jgi:hypothetical protein
MLAAASLVMLSATTPAHAADTTPLDPDPGPAGSFAWKGFNWEKRFWGGAPMFNKTFDASNVSNPDSNASAAVTRRQRAVKPGFDDILQGPDAEERGRSGHHKALAVKPLHVPGVACVLITLKVTHESAAVGAAEDATHGAKPPVGKQVSGCPLDEVMAQLRIRVLDEDHVFRIRARQ